MRLFVAIFVSLPLLAGCAGGGGSVSAPTLRQPPLAAPLGSVAALTEFQSDARQAPQPLATPGTNDLLYVSNQGSNAITIYKHDVSGNTAPLKVIAGSKTGLRSPGQLSEDARGNLYVANGLTIGNGVSGCCDSPYASVLVFAHGANGNVAPIRKLAGSRTGMTYVAGLTVDQSTGKLFVSNAKSSSQDDPPYPQTSILRFAPNATGNEAPFAASAYAGNSEDTQLASDSTGQYLLEQGALVEQPDAGQRYWVNVIAKQFANNTTPAKPYGISTFCTVDGDPSNPPCTGYALVGVVDDPTTKTYLTSSSTGIQRFSEKAIEYTYAIPLPSISTITSAIGCSQLALGYLRNIYAVCGTNTIKVFTHDSSGNVPPLRVLKGSATKLDRPSGLYEGQ